MNKEKIEEALKWVKERIEYITQNCDLQEEDNKKALYILKNINICLQEVKKQSKIINEMANFILDADYEKNKNSNKDYYIRCKEEVKQYFEKKAEGK